MQLISCAPMLRIDIRGEQQNYTPTGHPLPVTPGLYIQFQRGGGNVPAHARQLVETLPGFRMGIGRDEDPYTRLGWWDSRVAQKEHGWSEEDHDYVVERLRAIGDPNVLEITEQKVDAPYAKYDAHRKTQGKRTLEHVFSDIATTYELAGFDVNQAVAYERQNLNNEKVLEFLSTLGAPTEPTEELIAA